MARFLVVDDDLSTIDGMTRLLTSDGHEVVAFTEGRKAVEALSTQPFDAVITDLEMPDVDGHQVVQRSREAMPHACVVVVSTRALDKRRDLVDAGACIVADKPFAYDEITAALAACRARGGPGAHGRCHMTSKHAAQHLLRARRG